MLLSHREHLKLDINIFSLERWQNCSSVAFSKSSKVTQLNTAEPLLKPTSRQAPKTDSFDWMIPQITPFVTRKHPYINMIVCVYYSDLKRMHYQDTKRWRKLERILLTEKPVWKDYTCMIPTTRCSEKGKTMDTVNRSVIARGLGNRRWLMRMNVSSVGYF